MSTEDIRHVIGSQLQGARIAQGMTQAEVAEHTGLKQAYISKMESGKIASNVDTINKYLEAIGGYKVTIIEK